MILVQCKCGKSFSVPAEMAGRAGKCTACGWRLVVPLSDDSPEAQAARQAAAMEAMSASSDQIQALDRTTPGSSDIQAVTAPQQLPNAEALVGREVAGYVVGRRLGDKHSSVFHARAPDGGEVALKVLPKEKVDRNPTAGKRFVREARGMQAIAHPNLIRLIDAGDERGSYWLSMELHKGWTLEEELASSGGKLPEAEVLQIALGVARGLEHLHGLQLIHRAVRPKHILLKETKLCGFGLLRSGGPGADGEQNVTMKGLAIGKPDYMSPEQVRGHEIDGRSDLFSLGVTLYQSLTGERPFSGPTPMAIVSAIIRKNPPSVATVEPGVSKATSTIVDRLLAKDPEDRYATAQQLARDLEKAIGKKPGTGTKKRLAGAPAGDAAVVANPDGGTGGGVSRVLLAALLIAALGAAAAIFVTQFLD